MASINKYILENYTEAFRSR